MRVLNSNDIPTAGETLDTLAGGIEVAFAPRYSRLSRWLNLGVLGSFAATSAIAGWTQELIVVAFWLPVAIILCGAIVASSGHREGFEEALDMEERIMQQRTEL